MRNWATLLLIAAAWTQLNCSRPQNPPATAGRKAEPVRITQFYTTTPKLPLGEKGLLCYGVENAKTVWLESPRQELSASASRCVEVSPTATTTYTLTAAGSEGQPATQTLTVGIGAARVKIIEVKISTLELKLGDQLNFCYKVENARSVVVEPIHFHGGAKPNVCFMTAPRATTNYVVTALGADGEQDQEKVTVKVHP